MIECKDKMFSRSVLNYYSVIIEEPEYESGPGVDLLYQETDSTRGSHVVFKDMDMFFSMLYTFLIIIVAAIIIIIV